MKLATSLSDFGRYANGKESIRLIREAGFRYIDYTLGGRLFATDDGWREFAKEMVDYAGGLDVRYVQAHSPNATVLTPDRWEKEVFWGKRSLEICREMGIPQVVIHAAYTSKPVCKETWYDLNAKFYRELLPVAGQTGVTILTENTTHANLPEGTYDMYTGAEMAEFIEYIDHPLLQAVWQAPRHLSLFRRPISRLILATLRDSLHSPSRRERRSTRFQVATLDSELRLFWLL